jgi:signal transduction histidine kinase
MKRTRVIEPNSTSQASRAPYHEIAAYVRELLKCDYALVALPEADAIRIRGFAGGDDTMDESPAIRLLWRLHDWGPVVGDEARFIAVPVSCDGRVAGALIGYSLKPGTFTAQDLEKLMAYAPVASGIFDNTSAEAKTDAKPAFTTDELRHFFRLITAGEFSACFAHEVRNPLTLIRGHLRFIEEGLTPDHPVRVNVDAIDRASRRIEEMAKRMLDFSRKRVRRTEPCNISELISDALRFVQPYVRTKFIDVQVHLDSVLPPIDADRWQIVHAIVNLLQNAADAMVEVDRRVLSIRAQAEKNEMQVVISDTGAGIAPENLPKIFEPFFTTKGDWGTGLGLYITKQVVEEHGGTVSVDTSPRGASFTISLPL